MITNAFIAEMATESFPEPPETDNCPRAQQKPGELKLLLDLINQEQPDTFLEIGTYYGGLAWAVHRSSPYLQIICVDNNSLDSTVDTGRRLEFLEVPSTFINGDSTKQSTLDKVKKVASQVDFVFIDGSHWYKDVKCDWELYSSIVKPGGIVVLADIAPHEESTSCGGGGSMDVDRLWEEIRNDYEHWVIQTKPDGWGVFGVIRIPNDGRP